LLHDFVHLAVRQNFTKSACGNEFAHFARVHVDAIVHVTHEQRKVGG
jgi:hypothetical protein